MSAVLSRKNEEDYQQINIKFDKDKEILWLYMDPAGRSCFTSEMIKEIRDSHRILLSNRGHYPDGEQLHKVSYQVMTSVSSKPYNLGGDLQLFMQCIMNKDRDGLRDYAKLCLEGIYPTINNFDGHVTTIALVHGHALGGGFESALSSSILIAERSSKMGLPEVLFNLFPGMGAYHLLARRLPASQVEKMIMSGKIYAAEELYEMGIVDIIAEDGDGKTAVYNFIRKHKRNWSTQIAIQKVRQIHRPITFTELMRVCDIWVDAAINLSEKDLRTMRRLVKSQLKLSQKEADIQPEQDHLMVG